MANCKFPVRFVTTNTRLGFVDVKSLGDKAPESVLYDSQGEPDNIYHSALVAYGFVYEYLFDGGVAISHEKTYFDENSPIWEDGDFQTDKNQEEFEVWVNTKKTEMFSVEHYHVSDNNCSHFTEAASDFLGGSEPKKHSSQRDWLIRNRHIANVIQDMLETSRPAQQPQAEENTE